MKTRFTYFLILVGAVSVLSSCNDEEKLQACNAAGRYFDADHRCTCPTQTVTIGQERMGGVYNYNTVSVWSDGVIAQSFLGDGKNAKKITLRPYLNASNVEISRIEVSLREDCSTGPCAKSLGSGTIPGSRLTTTTQEVTLELGNQVHLSTDRPYWIFIRFIDLNGQINFSGDGNVYQNGDTRYSSDNGSSWTTTPNGDLWFRIHTCDE